MSPLPNPPVADFRGSGSVPPVPFNDALGLGEPWPLSWQDMAEIREARNSGKERRGPEILRDERARIVGSGNFTALL